MSGILDGKRVLYIGEIAERALTDFFRSLGAVIEPYSEDALPLADFLLDGEGLVSLESRGIARDAIEAANPSLIHVSVSTFGSFGAKADWKGSELIASAASGVLFLTGTPDRPPVKEALNACTFHADMVAACGAMAALRSLSNGGKGQHIDVSIQEVAFNRNVNSILVWHFDKRKLSRVGAALNYGKATVKCIWQLKDGWCFHSLMSGRFGAPANKALSDWIDEAGIDNPLNGVDWLAYDRSALPPDTRAIWEKALAEFFLTITKEDIRTEGRRRGINACMIATPADVLKEPHLQARGFWDQQDGIKKPSRFTVVNDGPLGPDIAPRDELPNEALRSGPLTGVRVLDFAWALVGSITTKTLGDLGAEVIKVESSGRPCLSRIDVQVSASQRGNMDDKPWFAHLNSSKKSLAIDLKNPASRPLIEKLVQWADVVVENFSPGTMDKLGLGYADLQKLKPDIIMVSGSVYGQTGPLAQEWGVDGTGGALSGRTYLTGYADTGPLIPGAVPYGDVIVPFVMAGMAAGVMERRERTGQGAHIDASMYEICVQQMKQAFAAEQAGAPLERAGNADPDVFWQDVLPSAGENNWLAVSCPTKEDYQLFLSLLKGASPAEWSASRSKHDAEAELQAAGIAASAVNDIKDLMKHEGHLLARGALVTIDHKHLGPFGHVRTPISFSGETLQPYPAPGMGEHCQLVAEAYAGLSHEEYLVLRETGVFR